MATNRKLINYLPQFMQEYFEMQKIMEAEQSEIDLLWTAAENVLADQFILEATENGVKRWESMLGVSPKDTDTLDERRFRILTRLNQELPYTYVKLNEVLITLCGEKGYSIEFNPDKYHIEVKLAVSNKNNYDDVEDLLKKVLPANMTQMISIMYNSNTILMKFTHEELSAYTHEQLRNEVFV